MLVEQHGPSMYRLAAAIVGAADGADVAQESLVTAWQQLPKLRDEGSFEVWLRRICVNRSRNWLRDGGRRAHGMAVPDVQDARMRDPGADFEGQVEARSLLEPAFAGLSVDHRAVLALHYSLGLSIAETADALGLRVGTVKSRLSAALAAMRREIAHPLREVETDDIGSEAMS